MNSRFLLIAAALIPAFLLSEVAEARSCTERLRSRSYVCDVKRDDGSSFEDCFIFTTPGIVSDKLDLFSEVAGFTLSCSCEAEGTFGNPDFDRSRNFLCVGADRVDLELATRGRAGGRRIKGNTVNDSGSSFVYRCRRVSSCPSRSLGLPDAQPASYR